jgi:hypothetical protein
VLHWRRILPLAAAAGAIIGIAYGDYFLVILAILLLAGAFFWRPTPDDEEEDE